MFRIVIINIIIIMIIIIILMIVIISCVTINWLPRAHASLPASLRTQRHIRVACLPSTCLGFYVSRRGIDPTSLTTGLRLHHGYKGDRTSQQKCGMLGSVAQLSLAWCYIKLMCKMMCVFIRTLYCTVCMLYVTNYIYIYIYM